MNDIEVVPWNCDKVVVVKYPYNIPSKCVVCGAVPNSERYFIDFGFDIDYYGTVYFCSDCFIAACKTLGYIGPTAVATFKTEIDNLKIELISLRNENAQLRSALGIVNSLTEFRGRDTLPFDEINETESAASKSLIKSRSDDLSSDPSRDFDI